MPVSLLGFFPGAPGDFVFLAGFDFWAAAACFLMMGPGLLFLLGRLATPLLDFLVPIAAVAGISFMFTMASTMSKRGPHAAMPLGRGRLRIDRHSFAWAVSAGGGLRRVAAKAGVPLKATGRR